MWVIFAIAALQYFSVGDQGDQLWQMQVVTGQRVFWLLYLPL
jgi:hypothetical protein